MSTGIEDAILKIPRLIDHGDGFVTYGYKMHSFRIETPDNPYDPLMIVWNCEEDIFKVYANRKMSKKELIEMAVDFIDRRTDGTKKTQP